MSTPINDGGPAFPQPCTEDGHAGNTPYGIAGGGMSLRDWFAGQALAGMPWNLSVKPKEQAKECYQIADAMIAARTKGAAS